jgi:hypothetical protein
VYAADRKEPVYLWLPNDANISSGDNAGSAEGCSAYHSRRTAMQLRDDGGRWGERCLGRLTLGCKRCHEQPRVRLELGGRHLHASCSRDRPATTFTPTRDMQPKSILKKTTTVSTNSPPASKPANPRHLQVALHHANIIEQRKQVEAEVLDSIITLMDFPTSPHADARRPTAADAQHFRDAMVPFQPSDYDALIEERNIADKCGYALCPKPKKKARSTARKQFIDTAHGVEIVDRTLLEVWCSDDCAKRALYVKVQLNEEPAWARQGGYGDTIELMVENAEEHHKMLPLRLKKEGAAVRTAGDEQDDMAAAWAARDNAIGDLAMERGERADQVSKANNDLIRDHITERIPSNAPPQPPSMATLPTEHTMAIEGHVPRIDRKDADEDEDDAHDWDKHLSG